MFFLSSNAILNNHSTQDMSLQNMHATSTCTLWTGRGIIVEKGVDVDSLLELDLDPPKATWNASCLLYEAFGSQFCFLCLLLWIPASVNKIDKLIKKKKKELLKLYRHYPSTTSPKNKKFRKKMEKWGRKLVVKWETDSGINLILGDWGSNSRRSV